jgi:hypothetical protein
MTKFNIALRRQCVKEAIQAWLDRAQPGLTVVALVSRDLQWHEVTAVVDDGEVSRDSNMHSVSVIEHGSLHSRRSRAQCLLAPGRGSMRATRTQCSGSARPQAR